MTKTMAEILAEHHSRQSLAGPSHKCAKCQIWFDDASMLADHQAEALSAAGYGLNPSTTAAA